MNNNSKIFKFFIDLPIFIYEIILLAFFWTFPKEEFTKFIFNRGGDKIKIFYYCAKVLQLTPDKNNSWELISYCTKGLKLLKSKAVKFPASELLYSCRAFAKYLIKDYKSSMRDCKKALEHDEKYVYAHFVIAFLYDKQGLYNKEIEVYNKIIELNNKESLSKALYCRALINKYLGKYNECKKDLFSSIKEDKKNLSAYYERAYYYYENANFTEFAINDLNTIINISKSYAYAYALKALILIDKQKYNEAIDLLKSVENTGDRKDLIFNALSFIYFVKGNYKKSLSYADRAILFDKENGTSYYRKACALISLGKYKNAGKFIQKANELNYCEIF